MSDLNEATAKETRRVTTGSDGVAVVRTDDATRISITADLDMHTARRARSIIESVCEARPSNVVIDLTGLEFVDSHGLNLLVDAHRTLTAAGCRLVFVPPAGHIRRAFAITGLDGLFAVRADA